MPRISNEAAMLRARHDLAANAAAVQKSLQRLATGLRINQAADDPAGLISADLLANTDAALVPAIEQAQRAGNLVATADAALGQMADLLLSIQQLILETANSGALNDSEVEANQLQVDAAVESIRRLTETTAFAGRRLLDGSLSYALSGVDPSDVAGLNLWRVGLDNNEYVPVRVAVTASAQPGILQFRTSQLAGDAHVQLAGPDGSEWLTFLSGAAASSMLLAINQLADQTGVSASLLNPLSPASGIQLASRQLGSGAFVSVAALTGSWPATDEDGVACSRDSGRDVTATINGLAATADGLNVSVHTSELELELALADGFTTGVTEFTVTGGGAYFPIGPSMPNDLATIGVPSTDPDLLGDWRTGVLSDLTNGGAKALASGLTIDAAAIVSAAIERVAVLRGRLGSFARYSLEQNAENMTLMQETVKASESAIRDADLAVETTTLTRAQILSEAATSVLAMANSSRQSILRLLA